MQLNQRKKYVSIVVYCSLHDSHYKSVGKIILSRFLRLNLKIVLCINQIIEAKDFYHFSVSF